MTIEIRNLQWPDHNSERAYPLTVEATRQDITGTFTLPDDFIVAIELSVHPGLAVEPAKFLIKSIQNNATGFGVVVGYDTGAEIKTVASASIARAALTPYGTYRLAGVGDFYDTDGTIMLGSTGNIDLQPAGLFLFDLAGGRLESSVVKPMIRGVAGIRVRSGADLSPLITGDIVLEAGANTRLTLIQDDGQDPRIVWDAISGEGLNTPCVCDDDIAEAPPIRRINGIAADSDGNFTLIPSTCVDLLPVEAGLSLTNPCSEPCCGCRELEIVTSQLEQFHQQATTLENFLTRLESSVTQMELVVLGSKLGDAGCVQCP